MKRIKGFVGVANAILSGRPAQIMFGRATVGEEEIYEPLRINGITPFDSAEQAASMITHLRQRQDEGVSDAYLASLDMSIAETEEELKDPIFMHSDSPMIVLCQEGTDTEFIGIYRGDAPIVADVPGSNLQFNGLKAFECYRDVLEVSRQATIAFSGYCPIATFNLVKVPS